MRFFLAILLAVITAISIAHDRLPSAAFAALLALACMLSKIASAIKETKRP